MLDHLARELLIGLGALCVGFLLGRWERKVSAGRPARERWGDIARVAIGLVMLGAVALTVYQVQDGAVADRERADCQAAFSTEVAEIIAKRSTATGVSNRQTAAAQEELAQLVDAILTERPDDLPPALVRFRDAIRAQKAATEDLERVRQAEPLPAPPNCG